jgi:hypothetical protein
MDTNEHEEWGPYRVSDPAAVGRNRILARTRPERGCGGWRGPAAAGRKQIALWSIPKEWQNLRAAVPFALLLPVQNPRYPKSMVKIFALSVLLSVNIFEVCANFHRRPLS